MVIVRALYVLTLILLAGGCASKDPIGAWQTSLVHYIVKEGNGDLNALRNVREAPSRKEFGVIGASKHGFPFIAPRRTDVTGVLLGNRKINTQRWYIFLVGAVEYRGAFVDFPLDDAQVKDLRVAAISGEGGEFSWLLGEGHAEATHQYCQRQLEAWRRSHPSRAEATEAPTSFPTPKDIFRLAVAPDAITVTDEHSLARWTLLLLSPCEQ